MKLFYLHIEQLLMKIGVSNILCFGELLKTQKVFLGKVFYSSDQNFKKFLRGFGNDLINSKNLFVEVARG